MTLARLYNFNDITVRDPSKVDSELNNIINLLNGTTDDRVIIKFDDPSGAPLTLDQSNNSGIGLDLQQASVQKAKINKNGCLEIAYSGAPIDLNGNNTVCTGLNVDLLDGIPTTAFNSNKALAQFFLGELQITKKTSGTQSLKLKQDADVFKLVRTSDSQSLIEFQDMEKSNRKVVFGATARLQSSYNPKDTDLYDVLRLKDLVTDKQDTLHWSNTSAVAEYNAVNKFVFGWVCPCGIPLMRIKKIYLYTTSGAGVFTITFYKNGVSIGTVESTAALTAAAVNLNTVDTDVVENDVIYAKVTAYTSNGGFLVTGFYGTW